MQVRHRAIAATIGLQGAALAMFGLTLVVGARYVGPAEFGQFSAVFAWASVLGAIGHLSLGGAVLYRASTADGHPWLARAVPSCLRITAGAALLSPLLIGGLHTASGGDWFAGAPLRTALLGALIVPLQVWSQFSGPLLATLGMVRVTNVGMLAGRVAGLAAALALGASGRLSAETLLLSMAAAMVVLALVGLRPLLAHLSPTGVQPGHGRLLMQDALRLHPNVIGTALFTWAGSLILAANVDPQDLGEFQAASNMALVLPAAAQAVAYLQYGPMARVGVSAAWPGNLRAITTGLAALTGLAAGAYVLAPWAVPLLLGEGFGRSVEWFQALLLSTPGLLVAALATPQWIGRGLFVGSATLTLATGALALALNAVLVVRYGITGALVAALIVGCAIGASNAAFLAWADRRERRTA